MSDNVLIDTNIWVYLYIETVGSFSMSEIGVEHVLEAMSLHEHYGYSYWDSLVIATALLCGCSRLYSEDMQHTQVIADKLEIINPFI
ncbi:MAG: hypothetical protein AB9873_12595 [Syntrophobacteraceae bacterium]